MEKIIKTKSFINCQYCWEELFLLEDRITLLYHPECKEKFWEFIEKGWKACSFITEAPFFTCHRCNKRLEKREDIISFDKKKIIHNNCASENEIKLVNTIFYKVKCPDCGINTAEIDKDKRIKCINNCWAKKEGICHLCQKEIKVGEKLFSHTNTPCNYGKIFFSGQPPLHDKCVWNKVVLRNQKRGRMC